MRGDEANLPIRRSLLTICLFFSVAALWAQEQEQRPTFRANVDVIRLDVSVLDKDRRPVRGLSTADFTVLEDGRERPIVAFAPVELPAAPRPDPSTAAWVRDAPRDVVNNEGTDEGRLVVIAFDWSIRLYDQQLARRIAAKAIDGLGPTDQAALVFTKPNTSAGMPQGFTTDRARLRAAIERPFAPADTCKPPNCDTKQIVNPERYEDGECLCGLCTLEALTRLADTLRPVSQRPKVVLFIGTYVRTYEVMKPTHIPPVMPGEITPTFTSMPGATDCPGRLLDARRAFDRAAHAANITVHVLDPVGLGIDDDSDPLGAGRLRERLDSLPVMADMTGGRTVSNTNAPENQVAPILDESSAYYVIGFEPGPGKANGDRHVEVRVKQRDLTARSRSSYNLASEPTSAAARAVPALTRSVSDVLPLADVPLEAGAVPLIAGRQSAALIVGRLAEHPAGPIQLLDAAFTPRSVPVVSRRVTLRPASPRGAQAPPLGLVSALALAPGSYEIRVGVQLSDGSAGSVHTFVDVPNFAREPLSMSGVLLHVAPEEPSAPRDEIDGVLPFAPTARRTFTQRDSVSAFVQVSQGTARTSPLTPVTLTMRVVDARDQVVRQQSSGLEPKAFNSHRTTNSRLAIPTAGLAPGQYLLKLDAQAGKTSVERMIRFSIQ